MGRHAASESRRGIAAWPLVVVGVVLILAAATVVYVLAVRGSDKADAAPCSGSAQLGVLAGPGSAPAAGALIKAYNATNPNARSTCITGAVVDVPAGSTAAEALATGWTTATGSPAVWLTDDPSQLTAVEQRTPALTAGRAKDPVATSPVVLAVPAGAAVGKPAWTEVLAAGPDAPGMTVPNPAGNRASAYALESALAPASGALTTAGVRAAQPKLAGLRSAAAAAPADTAAALAGLTAGGAQPAPVPVTEADLATYNTAHSQSPLTAVYPTGRTAGDAMYVVPLGGEWVDSTQSAAASGFASFIESAAGKKALAAAHWRVPGGPATTGTGITPSTEVQALPSAAPDVVTALAAAIGYPADGGSPSAPAGTSAAPGTGADKAPTAAATTAATSPATPGSTATPSAAPTSTAADTTAPGTTAPDTAASGAVSGAPASGTGGGATVTPLPPQTVPAKPAPAKPAPAKPSPAPPPAPAEPATILLLDTSSAWDVTVDGRSRMQWLQEAVSGALSSAGNRSVGLWTTSSRDDAGYAEVVPAGPMNDAVNGTQRSTAIGTAVAELTAGGGNRTYAAVPAALRWLSEHPVDGRPQRVILVTANTDNTPDTSRAQVIAAVQEAIAGQQIRLDIVGVGENAPDQALTDLAQAGGGSYTDVQQTPNLGGALTELVNAT